jgi:iron complex outermembrane recepter protein
MVKLQLGLLLAGLALSATVAAQTAQSGALEEVVVTAQKRAENVQTVPLSITALSAVSLDERAVSTFFDYAGQVPNLAFSNTGDGSGTARTISIRGISGDGTTGFYIDETPVPDSIDPRVLDVQRIEVLRGPQGTLYGARSMGGTVRLITQQPDFNGVSGRVGVSGSKTDSADSANYGIDGAVNVPLNDMMAARFVGFYEHEAGFFKRRFLTNAADAANLPPLTDPTNLGSLATTTRSNVGQVNSYGASGALLIKFSDALTMTPRIMYQKSDANGLLYSDVGAYPVPGPASPPPVSMTPSSLVQYRFFDIPESSSDAWTLLSVGVKYDSDSGAFFSSTSYFDRTVDETEDQTDFLYQNLEAPFDGAPLDASNPNSALYQAVPIAASIRELKQIHRFVQEFRFTSKLSGPLQYTVGLYFSDTRGRVPYAGYYPPSIAPGISQTGGFIPTGVVGIPVNPLLPDEIFGQDYQTKVREPAIYGELSYQFTEQLKGTVGLRGYQIKTTTGGYLEGIAFGGPRLTDPTAETTDSGVNPKAGLDWTVAPGKMLYAQVAKGFRPGGLVPSIPGNAASDPLGCYGQLTALGYTSAAQTKSYQPDKLWNYEAGAKTAWADNRFTVNGAGFLIKWDQIQQLVALPCGFQFRANSGAAEIKGAELEFHGRPTPNLDLSAGAGYQRARITEASPLLPALQVGDRVYYVPDWTGNAAVAYTVPIGTDQSFVGTVDWVYTGDSVSASVSATNPRVRPSYNILDARLAYEFGAYELALVGKNLTNTLANLGDNRSLAAETIGRPRLVVNTPRTIGLDFRAKF